MNRDSRAQGDQIACDTLVLWGSKGVVHRLFDPMALWQAQCGGTCGGRGPCPAGTFCQKISLKPVCARYASFYKTPDSGAAALFLNFLPLPQVHGSLRPMAT